MPRPIQAKIDLSALEHNLQVVRHKTGSRIMAVIKANAYGHGLVQAAEALSAADGFALLDIAEAVKLREAGFRQTMLLLEGAFDSRDMPLLAEYDLAAVIHSSEQIDMLNAYPRRQGLQAWFKLNTGMNRLGFPLHQAQAALDRVRCHPAVREVTLMTHFANADNSIGISSQLEKFSRFAAASRMPFSVANSATLLRFSQAHGDWVRPGIMLYGTSPFADVTAQELGLRPVMTLLSRLISVQDLKRGEQVGYAGLFTAEQDMRIGIVACGYGDGYPRHAPTGTPVLVNGTRTRTLGRVSMDMLAVDLSNIAGADAGSEVVLWGAGLPVDEVAHAAGTISYEVLCALAARVPVIYR